VSSGLFGAPEDVAHPFQGQQVIGIRDEREAGGRRVQSFAASKAYAMRAPTRWKTKFGGLEAAEARRSKTLEGDESTKMRWRIAEPVPGNSALKDLLDKK